MAASNCIAAPPEPSHPLANPGYGKRCVPDQLPRRHGDFSHLPRREASIAAYIDGLPDGAAVDIKTLAAHLPDYGQAACRTALNRIADAGHLRRFREQIDTADGGKRWVTRTFFSRGARDNAWWRAFQRSHGLMPLYAEVGEPDTRQPAAVEAESAPVVPSPRRPPRPQHPVRTPAYDALAALGRAESRLTLSARDCAALEALAAQWLARAPDRTHFTFALTAGLPPEITHPAALVRTRLENKMPPEPAETQQPKLIMLCTNCDRPGEPDALPGGLCAECRGEPAAPATFLSPAAVRAHAAHVRESLRSSEGIRAGRCRTRDRSPGQHGGEEATP